MHWMDPINNATPMTMIENVRASDICLSRSTIAKFCKRRVGAVLVHLSRGGEPIVLRVTTEDRFVNRPIFVEIWEGVNAITNGSPRLRQITCEACQKCQSNRRICLGASRKRHL